MAQENTVFTVTNGSVKGNIRGGKVYELDRGSDLKL